MFKNINYKNLSFLLITITTINYIFFTHRFFQRENGFILGDWLINYEGGFTRRGLFGEIITTIVQFFKIDIINFTFFGVIILYLLFIFLFLKLLIKSEINFLIALIIFSPATFLFNFYDPLAIGRKEFLFFLFFLIHIIYRDKKLSIIFIPLLAFIITLIHELLFFLIPFLFVNRLIQIKSLNFKNYNLEIFSALSIFFATTLLILSNDPNSKITCDYIKEFGLSSNSCWAINLTSVTSINTEFKINEFYIISYLPFVLVIFLHFFLTLKKNFEISHIKNFLFLLFTFLPILSLFFIVNDWGRYLNVYAFVWMIIIIFNNNLKNIQKNNFTKVLLILLYSISWYIPHCCPERHFSEIKYKPGLYYLIERINYRLNN